ncbi:hypothetical protein [Nonomuraea phyllanthi]|uniref:hypothetical protein n=1 Tax=Nonomuraea phyllanthi TaxID=2219224 RepID=UPI00129332B9|nr:hypothetical protein [Nonomuraea phyllanthi]
MYKQAFAAFAATSGLLLAAGPAAAEDTETTTTSAVPCSNRNGYSYNLKPPPPLTGDVRAEDVEKLIEKIMHNSALFPASAANPAAPNAAVPAPTPSVPSGTPGRNTIESWVNQAITCAQRGGAKAPQLKSGDPESDDFDIWFGGAVAAPAPVCTATTAPAAPAPAPSTLLEAVGVTQLISALMTGQFACVPQGTATTATQPLVPQSAAEPVMGTVPQVTAQQSASLLDSLGVTDLISGLLGN